jgi:hypothetical protein
MKSAEVSADAEILSSIYLFFGDLSAGTFGCGSLGGVSVSATPGSSLMIFASRSRFLIRDNQDQIVRPEQRLSSRRSARELP